MMTCFKHRITHGMTEGLNRKIMSIKRKAQSHRSKRNFKAAGYFFRGGRDL